MSAVRKEGRIMRKRFLSIFLSISALIFYIGIILYSFFAILHIQTLANFGSAVFFELIGFALLAYFIIVNLSARPIKIGYFVPLVMVTFIYTVLLDVINFAFVMIVPHIFFILLHLTLLFIYCVISIPMYVMGKR